MAVRDILIVEDQALARMYLCACVEKCANCRVAGTLTRADAALRRCGDGHIDLILMDICTENDSDGLTAAEVIKKIYPHIKIVMVTSMLEGRFLERARRIGADSFWYKDSPSGDLVGVIEGTLVRQVFLAGRRAVGAAWERPVLRLIRPGAGDAAPALRGTDLRGDCRGYECGGIHSTHLYQPDAGKNRLPQPQPADGRRGQQAAGGAGKPV